MKELKEIAMMLVILLVGILVLFCSAVFSSCSSYHTTEDSLRLELKHKNELINAYEAFRRTAILIYVTQVDSTGDGFNESDDGIEFWHKSARIDSIGNKIHSVKY